MASISLSLVEIIVLMLGAITLGITIHFFITSQRSLKNGSMAGTEINRKELDDWKMRYFNDVESRDKELSSLKDQLNEITENANIYSIEAEEMRKNNRRLQQELEATRKASPSQDRAGYLEQLRDARENLLDQNEKIGNLISQIEAAREQEETTREIREENELLKQDVEELQIQLSRKEKELVNFKQKEQLSSEMTSMLDKTYAEFNILQEKIQKLESQVSQSKRINMEYDDLKEEQYRISHEMEEQKHKYQAIFSQNQQLRMDLAETEDKLREANFQRLQLQKKVAYLEELSNDLQVVTEANKKLESQIRRVGELESLLQVTEEERDELNRRQQQNRQQES